MSVERAGLDRAGSASGGVGRGGLVAIRGMAREAVAGVLRRAAVFEAAAASGGDVRLAPGRVLANLFFEDSTRTRASFAVAAQRLGMGVLDLPEQGSSSAKGETLLDTARTLESAGADVLVVRAKAAGSAALVARSVGVPVVNAGDGRHEHPTQGLLDCYALAKATGRASGFDLSGLRVAIVGDVLNSRVARSDVHAMTSLGAEVVLVGPREFVPRSLGALGCSVSHDLDGLIGGMDAVQMLRVQFERHWGGEEKGRGAWSAASYRVQYAMTAERLARLKRGAVVMHPGPANVGLEIDGAVFSDERSLVREQVRGGLYIRMAVLAGSLGV